MIEETISDDTGVMVKYKDTSYLFTSHDGDNIIKKDKNGITTTTTTEALIFTKITRKDNAREIIIITNRENGSSVVTDNLTNNVTYFNINNDRTDSRGNIINEQNGVAVQCMI